jgi:hypothetical protein
MATGSKVVELPVTAIPEFGYLARLQRAAVHWVSVLDIDGTA